MADDPDRTRDDLITENRDLRAELDRLRGLLGLDVRSASGHEQSWEPTLFSEAGRHENADHTSTVSDKLALYRSLFGGRTDVYAHRWENLSTGKSGWSPTGRGGWSSKSNRNREYMPLTDDVFASHLRGEATIGIYPLLRGDTCTLLACDFDGDGWPLDALALVDACHAAQVPAILERSRSGDGDPRLGLLRISGSRSLGPSDGPTDPKAVRNEFDRLITTAGIEGRWTPNLLRHTAASLMADAGMPIEHVADQLGHKDLRMLQQHHRHRIKPTIGGAHVLDSVLGANPPSPDE